MQRYTKDQKKKIREMRKKGLSYGEITKKTGIPKSTLSSWLKGIPLTKGQKKRLYFERMNKLNTGKYSSKERRKKEVDKIKKLASTEISNIKKDTYKIAGAMLYWGEGGKTGVTEIANSDPVLVKFMTDWFVNVCGWSKDNMVAKLHLHPGDDEDEIKKYWSNLIGIPLSNFKKTYIKPKGTGHRKNVLYYGVIQVRLKGKGTVDLRHKIMTWAYTTAKLCSK